MRNDIFFFKLVYFYKYYTEWSFKNFKESIKIILCNRSIIS